MLLLQIYHPARDRIFGAVTTPDTASAGLDLAALNRWPIRAAAHTLGIGLLLAVLAALPMAPSDLDRHQFPKETLWHAAVFIAVLLARPWPGLGSRRSQRFALVLFGGWSVITMVVAANPWLAWRAVTLTTTSLIALHTARYVAAAGAASVLIGWAATAAAAGAITGLAQAFGFEHSFFNELRAPGGTLGNRNFLAHIAAAALPVHAYLMVTARRRNLPLVAIGMAACMAMLVMSRSRAGWLAALAGTVVMLFAIWLARRSAGVSLPRSRLMLILVTPAIAVGAAVLVPTTLEWRSDSPYTDTLGNIANFREGSGRGRMLQYRNSLKLTQQHPVLGVGPGNWALHYGSVAPRNDPSFARNDVVPLNPWPSSDAVALLAERGIPGALAALLLVFACGWRAVPAVRAGDARALGGAALAGTIASLGVAGMFDAVLLLAVPAGFAAITIGALLSRADGDVVSVVQVRRSKAAAILVVLVGAGLIRSAAQTAAYVVAGDGSSRQRLERAVFLDPFNYQLQIRLARGPCRAARPHAAAALRLAPTWPAAQAAARRCGVKSGD